MQYKGPKYFFFYLTIFVFFLTLFVFQNVAPNQINLGSYSVKDEVSSKMYLNLLNISKIDLEIEDIYTSNQDNLCSTGDIYVYGTLRRSDNLVRIRLQDVKADPSLTINSKSSTIEPTRNYEQFPLNVTSKTFDCTNKTITVYFEEEIHIRYLEFDNSNASYNTNTIKTYRITAYS